MRSGKSSSSRTSSIRWRSPSAIPTRTAFGRCCATNSTSRGSGLIRRSRSSEPRGRNVLTWDGSLAAFVVGMVIGIFGDVTWLFLLLFFLLSSFLATRYRFALKEAMGVQEGIRGERRATNVLANGVALMAVAVLSLIQPPGFPRLISGVVFLSALSVAGSDTLASEIGVLSRPTY